MQRHGSASLNRAPIIKGKLGDFLFKCENPVLEKTSLSRQIGRDSENSGNFAIQVLHFLHTKIKDIVVAFFLSQKQNNTFSPQLLQKPQAIFSDMKNSRIIKNIKVNISCWTETNLREPHGIRQCDSRPERYGIVLVQDLIKIQSK